MNEYYASYEWKCKVCKKKVVARLSGYCDDEHVHCPICGDIRYIGPAIISDFALFLFVIFPPIGILAHIAEMSFRKIYEVISSNI